MKKKKERKDPDKKKGGIDEGMKERQSGEILRQNEPRVREFRGGREEAEIVGGSEVLEQLWCNLGSRLATAEVKN